MLGRLKSMCHLMGKAAGLRWCRFVWWGFTVLREHSGRMGVTPSLRHWTVFWWAYAHPTYLRPSERQVGSDGLSVCLYSMRPPYIRSSIFDTLRGWILYRIRRFRRSVPTLSFRSRPLQNYYLNHRQITQFRHSGAGRNPFSAWSCFKINKLNFGSWIPACAGMTGLLAIFKEKCIVD